MEYYVYFFNAIGTNASSRTCLYIDKGNITIGASAISGYDINGNLITATNWGGYEIPQTSEAEVNNNIIVESGVNTSSEINNVNINASDQKDGCSFFVSSGANVEIILEGNNILISGQTRAGLEAGSLSTLVISGTGNLTAKGGIFGAGIGSALDNSASNITIFEGNINASSEGYGAGIGSGSGANAENIQISVGLLTLTNNDYGACIGGGQDGTANNITVNDGTILAKAGSFASVLGGGNGESGSNVVIKGGSISPFRGGF